MAKTAQMRLLEIERGQTIEQMFQEGVEAGLSWREIARRMGISYTTLNDWRRNLGVRTRMTIDFVSEEAGVA
jgi:transposase-like protein